MGGLEEEWLHLPEAKYLWPNEIGQRLCLEVELPKQKSGKCACTKDNGAWSTGTNIIVVNPDQVRGHAWVCGSQAGGCSQGGKIISPIGIL